MKIRFLNLSVQSKKELEVHTKIYKKFLKQGNFVLGPSVDKFESKISRIVKKKYTVGLFGLLQSKMAIKYKKGYKTQLKSQI